MHRREYKKNGRPFIIEEFKGFGELIEICKGREANWTPDQLQENGEFQDKKWVGCKTYEEAQNLLKYGWQDKEKIKYLKDKVNNLSKTQSVEKISFKNDIVGFAPIVPNAIIGVPQSMINTARKPKKAKVITILADMSVSSSTSTEEYLNWGAELVSKIVQLEKNGFRVRLEYVNVFSKEDYGKVHACRVLMKSENQPFDIKRYMFPLAHTAMFRGLMFDWYEKLPNAEKLSGYGCSLYHHYSDRQFIKDEICNSDNCYYIICKENIDKALKDVK